MSDGKSQETQAAGSNVPPMDRVRHEMERWLEVARTTGERALESLGLLGAGKPSSPAVDLLELEPEIVVLVDLPGVAAEAVQLSLVGNMLTVKASRKMVHGDRVTVRHLSERTAQFERSIPLPVAADLEDIKAETRDGLLTITIRKTPAPQGRSIPVVHAGSAKHAE